MSEFKGTPGPWSVGDEGTTAKVVSDTGLVCEIGFGWDEDADSRAISDARLIAAAPDLLEALEALMDIETADVDMDEFDDSDSIGAYQDENGDVKDLPLTFGHLRRARAAIAKALGQ